MSSPLEAVRHPVVLSEERVSPKPKCVNRHDAKGAMIGKAQKPNTVPDATAAQSVVGDSGLTSALASLGGPRWRLGGKTVSSDQG
jgi:hypothetical protein